MKKTRLKCGLCNGKNMVKMGDKKTDSFEEPIQLKLEKCVRPFSDETARLEGDDDPCNDGTDASNN